MKLIERPRTSGWLAGALPDRRSLAALVLAQQLIGVALGLIWLAWSPRAVSYLLDAGNGNGVVVPAQSETQIASDGRYAVLTVLAGVLFGLLAWRLRSNRGPVTIVVLAASSVLGSLLALATGQLLAGGDHASALNTAFHPPLVLHGTAEIFLQALLATLVYTVFVGLSGDRQLGRPAAVGEPQPGGAGAEPEPVLEGGSERPPGSPDEPGRPDEPARRGQPDEEFRQPDSELRRGG